MAVAFFAHTSGAGIDASAEGTIPASTPDGAVMLAFLAHSSATATMTTPASGWTLLEADPNPADFSALAYWRIKQAGDAAPTWTWSAAGNWTVDIASFTGTHATTPVNTSIGEQIAAASSIVLGPVTPTAADCMLVAFGAVDAATGTRTWTESGAMTEALDQVNNEIHRVLAYELLAGGSGVAVSRTLTATDTAQDMAGFLIALEPAAGGGGGGGGASVAGEARPDTALTVVVTDAAGNTTTLDSHAPDPGDRPIGLSFSTQLGTGFAGGGFSLSRLIDRDNVDLSLLDDVRVIGVNGDTAYEGFVGAMPRSMDSAHSVGVTLAGWMATAADESFVMPFVDRDMNAWGSMSRARRGDYATNNVYEQSVSPDRTNGSAVLVTAVDAPWTGQGICEPVYDAGPGTTIGSIYYAWTKTATIGAGDTNWVWDVGVATTDTTGPATVTGNLRAAGPGSGTYAAPAGNRYGFARLYYSVTVGGTARYAIEWNHLAVYGNHGLPLIGATQPYGVAASDVIRWLVANHCPMLNADGVQDTTYPIGHLVFRERTRPYDAMLKVNSYHIWNLSVWEDRTLHFAPVDLTEWDWEVRHDEVGVSVGLQGDSVEKLRNGIIVQYTDLTTQATNELHPDNYAELRDDSVDNPANAHGRNMYGDPFVIPFPCLAANALELGRLRLLEDNQPSAPGSFTVQRRIRDRAGNWQPVWKVRAGDRVRLTSSASLSDRPRLIHETSYSHDDGNLTIGVDSTLRMIEGYLDRMDTALAAAGLQS